MQYYRCKCGKVESWNTGEGIHDCKGCEECKTVVASPYTKEYKPLQPHKFDKKLYNQNTGKPYFICSQCYRLDKVSYEKAKEIDD